MGMSNWPSLFLEIKNMVEEGHNVCTILLNEGGEAASFFRNYLEKLEEQFAANLSFLEGKQFSYNPETSEKTFLPAVIPQLLNPKERDSYFVDEIKFTSGFVEPVQKLYLIWAPPEKVASRYFN